MQKYRFNTIRKLSLGALSLIVALLVMFSMLLTDWNRSVSADTNTGDRYTVDYDSLEEQREAGRKLAAEVAGEGMVLLKNENGALPLAAGVRNVSVFGKRGQDPVFNGSGSGGNSGITTVGLYDALGSAGFNVNPVLSDMYARTRATGNIKTGSSGQSSETVEVPVTDANYTTAVTSSYASYKDAAIIVIGRGGGEGGDLKRANVDGHTDVTEHSLELNDAEKALLAHVKANGFTRIIYLINTAAAFELAPLQDDPDVDAILWIGMPGGYGMTAAAQILTGATNPSGRLPAIYPSNFKQDPTWFNVGNNNQLYGLDNGATAAAYGDSYNGTEYMQLYGMPSNLSQLNDENGGSYFWSLNYEEGIYMGYRWYETAASIPGYYVSSRDALPENAELPYGITAEGVMPEGVTDAYYNRYNGVLYPFGYGLSYTQFTWEVGAASVTSLGANTSVTIPVTVRNTGSAAGKEVVQVYSNPPYTAGEIEKATANLITFGKTDELQPNESQTLELTFNARDLASFDYNDANGNGFAGYELEQGDYRISLSSNSHIAQGSVTLNVASDIVYDGSTDATNYNEGFGENSEAIFSQDDKYNTNISHFLTDEANAAPYVSRADWKLPAGPKDQNGRTLTADSFQVLLDNIYSTYGAGGYDEESDPYYVDEVPEGWEQAANTDGRTGGKTAIQLADMAGVAFDDARWTQFMNQLTYNEMVSLISSGSYSTPALDAVGKPRTTDQDGPTQLGSGSTSWPSEPVQSATFNTSLGYEIGRMVGNESILIGYAGWYGPGMNTNRSPFGGRNFEYYSQDGVHAGLFGAEVTRGATDMGVLVYAKHMVLNDQESYRYGTGGTSAWLPEQAFREIYMRPWEYAIKYGNLNAAMSSYSKVGLVHSTGNFMLNHVMLMDEWGFNGIIVTDMYGSNAANRWSQGTAGDLAARNGVFPLGSYVGAKVISGRYNAEQNRVEVPNTLTASDWSVTRRANGGTYLNNQAIYTATVTASSDYIESASQWFWVRNTAQRMLFTVGNSNAMAELHTYNITFDLNYDGAENLTYTVDHGDSFEMPAEPVRPGFTFTGWANDKAGTSVAEIDTRPVANKTYYATWAPGEGALTVTFNENYFGAPEVLTVTAPYGNPVPAPETPVRSGYTFAGWYTDAACTDGNEANLDLPVYQNYNLYAKWVRNAVTLTFNVNGGAGGNIVRTIDQYDALVFPEAPTRDGYTFAGWTTVSGRNTTYVSPGTPVASNTTYTAQWVATAATNITTTFSLNYGGSTNRFTVVTAQNATLPVPSAPVREGYTFTGWYDNENGTGTRLASNTRPSANSTYYAGWEVAELTVTVDVNYNGGSVSEVTANYGDVLSEIGIAAPTRDGYTFLGWYRDLQGRIIVNMNDNVTSDMTLYAKWLVNDYTVTFDYQVTGMENATQSVTYNQTATAPADPVRYGYLFDGWFDNAEGTGFALDIGTLQITGNTTYYAKWLANSSDITFNANNGTQNTVVTVENGASVERPADPVREGYVFAGWYSDEALTVEVDFSEGVAGDATYYAAWTKEGNGGCGSIVSVTSAAVAAGMVLVLCTALIVSKKKESK